MKRILLVSLAFLVLTTTLILVAVPYVLGFTIEEHYNHLLRAVSKPDTIELKLVSYQRGWLTSDAVVEATITNSNVLKFTGQSGDSQTPLSFTIKQHIEHGPVFQVSTRDQPTRFLMGQAFITSRADTAAGRIDSLTWIKLDGSLLNSVFSPQIEYHSPAFSMKAPQPAMTVWLLHNQQLTLHIDVPQLDIKTPQVAQQVVNAHLRYQLSRQHSVQATDHLLTIDKITWQQTDATAPIIFNGLSIESRQRQDQQKMDTAIAASLKEADVGHASYGPQLIAANINQMDIAAFQQVKDQLTLLRNNPNISEDDINTYQQRFYALLAKGMEVQVQQFNLVTPWGSPSLRARITFMPQDITPTQFADLLPAMDAAVQANIPATFLVRSLEKVYGMLIYHASTTDDPRFLYTATANVDKASQQQITEWVTKRWLLPKDNGYQVNFLYHNQQGVINGEPWSLAKAAPSLKQHP
jgi:uncharacterized protein YdgA (DUF945 family)